MNRIHLYLKVFHALISLTPTRIAFKVLLLRMETPNSALLPCLKHTLGVVFDQHYRLRFSLNFS